MDRSDVGGEELQLRDGGILLDRYWAKKRNKSKREFIPQVIEELTRLHDEHKDAANHKDKCSADRAAEELANGVCKHLWDQRFIITSETVKTVWKGLRNKSKLHCISV